MVSRLRESRARWPQAKRFIVHGDWHPSIDELTASTEGLAVAVYGTALTDTCKEVVDGLVRRTIPRDALATLSGPWVFSAAALGDGLRRLSGRDPEMTSLPAFCEAARLQVRVLPRS